MTKVKLHAPVAEMHGEFEKNSGIIMRQKKYRAPNGAVLKVGVQESYKIAHPRDVPNSLTCALSAKSAVWRPKSSVPSDTPTKNLLR